MGTGAAGPQGYSAQLSSFGAPAAPGYSTRASGVADPYNYPSPYDPTGTYAPTGTPLGPGGQPQFIDWVGSNPWATLATGSNYSGLRTEDIFSATSGLTGTLGTGTFQNPNPNYYIRDGPRGPGQIGLFPATNYAYTDWGDEQFRDYLTMSAFRGGARNLTPDFYSNPQYGNLIQSIDRDYGRVPLDQILSFSRAWQSNPLSSGQYEFPGSGAQYSNQSTQWLPTAAYNPVGLDQAMSDRYEQHRNDWLYNMYFLDPTVNAQIPGSTVEWPEWDPGLFTGTPYEMQEALSGDLNGDGIPDNMPLSQSDFFSQMGEGLPTWAETYWDYGAVPNPYYSTSLFPWRGGNRYDSEGRPARETLSQFGRRYLENLTPAQLYLSSFYPNMSLSDVGRDTPNLNPGLGVWESLGGAYRNAPVSQFFGAPSPMRRRRPTGRGGGGAPAGYAWRTRDPEAPDPWSWGGLGDPFPELGEYVGPSDPTVPSWAYGSVEGESRPPWSATDYSGVFTDPYITPSAGWYWAPGEEQVFVPDPSGPDTQGGVVGRYVTPLDNPLVWEEGVPAENLNAVGWPVWDADVSELTPSGMMGGSEGTLEDPLSNPIW